ncbi:MAG: hypothetical protein HGB12_12695 [Bacteroidetes bacterium]|nr:hypothetical protein [Bacteroidota bacterium]
MNNNICPVCHLTGTVQESIGNTVQYICKRCGTFKLDMIEADNLDVKLSRNSRLRTALSYYICSIQQNQESPPYLSLEVIEKILAIPNLPSPTEQAENLLIWVADQIETPGVFIQIDDLKAPAKIGAKDINGVTFIVDSMIKSGLIINDTRMSMNRSVTLSFEGWDRVDQLRRRTTEGLTAFMAMSFHNFKLMKLYEEYFKVSIKEAGFVIKLLSENLITGLIDEKLRVEIRRAAFIVADLTDGNQGAYWEAGFAEGLGKPVIYICEASVFKNNSTHFDTNHLHTVMWDLSNPKKAAEDLKATIRATLPHLAKMNDD